MYPIGYVPVKVQIPIRLQLRVLRFHALRHGAGSIVARQADPRWVQGFLGHLKLTTTERYLHAKACGYRRYRP